MTSYERAELMVAIDTSGAVSVAVCDGAATLAERTMVETRRHAEAVIPLLDEVMREAGATAAEVSALAVGRGPGMFTGLRVGIVTARVLAHAWAVPLYGVSSLDALALQVCDSGAVDPGAEFVTTIHAGRGEIYWGRYRAEAGAQRPDLPATLLDGPQVTRPSVVPTGLPCFGRGALLHADVLGAPPEDPLDVAASALARMARVRPDAGTAPFYLRRPDAEENVTVKSVLGSRR